MKNISLVISFIFLFAFQNAYACNPLILQKSCITQTYNSNFESENLFSVVLELKSGGVEYENLEILKDGLNNFRIETYTTNPCDDSSLSADNVITVTGNSRAIEIDESVRFIKLISFESNISKFYVHWEVKQLENCNEIFNSINTIDNPLKVDMPVNGGTKCIVTCNTKCGSHYDGYLPIGEKILSSTKFIEMNVRGQGILKVSFSSTQLDTPRALYYGFRGDKRYFIDHLDLLSDDIFIQCGSYERIVIVAYDKYGKEGDFSLCFTSFPQTNSCINFFDDGAIIEPASTSKGSPLGGPYIEGEEVTFSYKIKDWMPINQNWLHGIHILYGNGWKGLLKDTIENKPIYTYGKYDETDTIKSDNKLLNYELNDTLSIIGLSTSNLITPGWYFNLKGPGPMGPGPKFKWGKKFKKYRSTFEDPLFEFSFTLVADTLEDCRYPKSAFVEVIPLSDYETGRYEISGCNEPIPEELNNLIKCCDFGVVHNLADTSLCEGESIVIGDFSNMPCMFTYQLIGSEEISNPIHGTTPFIASNSTDAPIEYKVEVFWRDPITLCEERYVIIIMVKEQRQFDPISLNEVCKGSKIDISKIIEEKYDYRFEHKLKERTDDVNPFIIEVLSDTKNRISLKSEDLVCYDDIIYEIRSKECGQSDIEKEIDNLSLYFVPNPAYQKSTMIITNNTEVSNLSIIIVNNLGKLVESFEITGNGILRYPFERPHWTAGVYTVNLIAGPKTTSGKLVIKNR